MTNIKRINFDGDSNIGLHAETSEDFCIMNPGLSERCYEAVEEVLGVEIIKTPVAGSTMPGIFCSANSKGVVLPRNVEEREKKAFEEAGIEWKVLKVNATALGNLIMVNDKACVVSERLSDVKGEIEELFQVPVKTGKIAGKDLLGSSSVVTNKGLLCHRDASEEEIEFLEEVFGLECGIGTVGFGVPFVGAGVVASSNGVLVSEDTTGPELGRVEQALIRSSE
ncbi:MAG: translation initiation factor IF-6 [Candidatus Aenigmatarchaeota archaeon]